MAKTSCLDLANELQLKVFAELSTKQIQSARRTCKHFRALIDEPSNLNALAADVEQRQITRLQQSVDHALNYTGVDLLDAFARFMSLDGVWQRHSSDSALKIFAKTWCYQQKYSSSLDKTRVESHRVIHAVERTAGLMRDLILSHDVSRNKANFKVLVVGQPGLNPALNQMGISKELIGNYYDKIVGGQLDVKIAPAFGATFPRWPLGGLHCLRDDRLELVKRNIGLVDTMNQASSALGVPKLPIWGNEALGRFSYCANSRWAYDKAKKALQGGTLLPLEKAAMLEDLYFF